MIQFLDNWSDKVYKEDEEDGVNPIGYVQDIFNDVDSILKNVYKIGKNGVVIAKHIPSMGCNLSKANKEYVCNGENDDNFACQFVTKSSDIVCKISDYMNPLKLIENFKKMNQFQKAGNNYKFNPTYFKNIKKNNKIYIQKPPVNNTMNVKLKKRV